MGLQKRGHEIISIGWFHPPDIRIDVPWHVYPTMNQGYGQDVFDDVIIRERPDCVLVVGDVWMWGHITNPNICKTRSLFSLVPYVAVDGETSSGQCPPSWIPALNDVDYLVPYTEYAKRVISATVKDKTHIMNPIPHGVDLKTYYPLPKEEVERYRRASGIHDKICFLTVARNQYRKNFPEMCKIWAQFKSNGKHEKAVWWPHALWHDQMGWNFEDLFDIHGIRKSIVFFEHMRFGKSNLRLMPESELARLYNICDVHLLLSSEGYGLPVLEAQACQKPCIVLDHSAPAEIAGDNERALKVKVDPYTISGTHCTERPYPHINDAVEKLDMMYRDEELRKKYAQAGYEWVQQMTWSNACDKWAELFERIAHPTSVPVTMEVL